MDILLTVGTQLPFDRLVRTVDGWAARHPDHTILAQIGADGAPPRHMLHVATLTRAQFAEAVSRADAIVAHAGIGSLLSAIEIGKPILVLPRRAALGEHRNDHQLATAREVSRFANVRVAWSEDELPALLDRTVAAPTVEGASGSGAASPQLLAAIGSFIDEVRTDRRRHPRFRLGAVRPVA